MFLTGLGLTIYEAVLRDAERPSLLILYMAMMGLPVVLGADILRRRHDDEDDYE